MAKTQNSTDAQTPPTSPPLSCSPHAPTTGFIISALDPQTQRWGVELGKTRSRIANVQTKNNAIDTSRPLFTDSITYRPNVAALLQSLGMWVIYASTPNSAVAPLVLPPVRCSSALRPPFSHRQPSCTGSKASAMQYAAPCGRSATRCSFMYDTLPLARCDALSREPPRRQELLQL